MAGRGVFELSRQRLIALLVLLLIAVVVCFVWAANVKGTWNLVAAGLASALLSVAAATLVTEVLLRPAFVKDLLELAGLKHRLDEIGLKNVVPESNFDWDLLYSGQTEIHALVNRPSLWVQTQLPRILNEARSHPVSLTVILADPQGEACALTAGAIGLDAVSYELEVRKAAADIEASWKDARKHARVHVGCALNIYPAPFPVTNSLTTNTAEVAFVISAPKEQPILQALIMHVARTGGSDVQPWIEDIISSFESAYERAPFYVDGGN